MFIFTTKKIWNHNGENNAFTKKEMDECIAPIFFICLILD